MDIAVSKKPTCKTYTNNQNRTPEQNKPLLTSNEGRSAEKEILFFFYPPADGEK